MNACRVWRRLGAEQRRRTVNGNAARNARRPGRKTRLHTAKHKPGACSRPPSGLQICCRSLAMPGVGGGGRAVSNIPISYQSGCRCAWPMSLVDAQAQSSCPFPLLRYCATALRWTRGPGVLTRWPAWPGWGAQLQGTIAGWRSRVPGHPSRSCRRPLALTGVAHIISRRHALLFPPALLQRTLLVFVHLSREHARTHAYRSRCPTSPPSTAWTTSVSPPDLRLSRDQRSDDQAPLSRRPRTSSSKATAAGPSSAPCTASSPRSRPTSRRRTRSSSRWCRPTCGTARSRCASC